MGKRIMGRWEKRRRPHNGVKSLKRDIKDLKTGWALEEAIEVSAEYSRDPTFQAGVNLVDQE
jgi:hypothetical protein